jgi:hypothetical protein
LAQKPEQAASKRSNQAAPKNAALRGIFVGLIQNNDRIPRLVFPHSG